LGASALIRLDTATGTFESFLPAFSAGDGFPILGGAAYFALASRDTTVVFAGKGWHGRQPRFAPPSGKVEKAPAPVLAVTGRLLQKARDGVMPLGSACTVEIRNARTGAKCSAVARIGSGHFAAAFVNFLGGEVARAGDVLLLRFQRPDGVWVEETLVHAVTAAEVVRRQVQIEGAAAVLPPAVTLMERGWPNPLQDEATLRFQLASPDKVSLRIYAVDGRLAETVLEGRMPAGWYEAHWTSRRSDGTSVAAGVYFVRFTAGSYESSQKLVVLR
jgi:hypothetical protein